MKKLLWLGIAAGVLVLAPALPVSAMSIPHQSTAVANSGDSANDIIQVRGHRGGRGHHYGWSRGHHHGWGRGHHYGWGRGHHHRV
jgi:hypothetical protein